MTPEQVSNYVLTAVEVTRRATLSRGIALGAAAVLAGLALAVAWDQHQRAQQAATPAQQPSNALHQDAYGRWMDEYGRPLQ